MTMHINPLRIAVIFDGDQDDIRGMAQDAVGQLAETAKNLGRPLVVKGTQTMDVHSGGVVNWSNWVAADAFDQNQTIQLAHCYRSNNIILGALYPLAVENEILSKPAPLVFPPRYEAGKIDAVLIATGRNESAMNIEFRDTDALAQILNGYQPKISSNPLGTDPRAFKPEAPHRGLIAQRTPVYSLATISGVEGIVQEKLSAPTSGMSFHGTSGEVKALVDAMAVTLADPDGARKRLVGNRFAAQLEYSKK
jgi:hypothetical protein